MNRPSLPAPTILWLTLGALLAVLLRLCPVVFWPSLDWGDEIYQAMEPAHRLVFGTGLVTWEFVAGIRSWLLPGAIAAVFALCRAIGAGPELYLPAVALCCATLSLVPVAGTFAWCRPRFGLWPAVAGATVAGLAPELVYFGARTLAETVAAHILIGGMFLAAPSPAAGRVAAGAKPWLRPACAGLLLGLAMALRPQIMPAAGVILLWPGTAGRWRMAAGAASMLAGSAVLDWLTLGAPGASIWRYALVNLSGASASFGVQPWYYFGLAEAAIWGAALPVPVALCVWGARRWSLPLAAALAVVAVHMAIGHKEHRFIYPALALGAVQAGIGMAALTVRLARGWDGDARKAAIVTSAGWAAVAGFAWTGPGLTALRHRAQDNLAAADFAATLPGICGIGMGPGKDAWVPYGGYTHLHRNVPLFWPADQAGFVREAPGFNLLLSETREPGFTVMRCFGPVCASVRAGSCVDLPADAMPPAPERKEFFFEKKYQKTS